MRDEPKELNSMPMGGAYNAPQVDPTVATNSVGSYALNDSLPEELQTYVEVIWNIWEQANHRKIIGNNDAQNH